MSEKNPNELTQNRLNAINKTIEFGVGSDAAKVTPIPGGKAEIHFKYQGATGPVDTVLVEDNDEIVARAIGNQLLKKK